MANARSSSPPAGAGDTSPTGMTGQANPKMRKRTKTGCLTCRKRRIKCGEERPTCGNCIKSKRQCEGYNQRVIFKPPIGDWPNHPSVVNTMQYHTSMLPGTRNQPYSSPESSTLQEGPLASIQSRPMANFDFSNVDQQMLVGGNSGYGHDQTYQQPLQSPTHQQQLQSPHHQAHMSTPTASYFPQSSPVHTSPPAQFNHDPNGSYQSSLQYSQSPSYPPISVSYNNRVESKPTMPQSLPQQSFYRQQYPPNNQPEEESPYRSHASVSPRSDHYPQYAEQRPVIQRYNSHPQIPIHSLPVTSADLVPGGIYNLPTTVSHSDFGHASYSSVPIPMHDMTPDVKYMPQRVLGMSRV